MSTATGSSLDLEQITKTYFAAWEARDPDRIAELHSDDTVFTLHAGPATPSVGRDAVRATFAGIFGMYPDFSFETHRVLLGERHWVLDWTMVSGDIRLHMLDTVEVDDDGQVSRKDTFADVAQMNAVLAGLEV
jgi:ketosteroid isomerase-like protein